jgi:hypothetical protein
VRERGDFFGIRVISAGLIRQHIAELPANENHRKPSNAKPAQLTRANGQLRESKY